MNAQDQSVPSSTQERVPRSRSSYFAQAASWADDKTGRETRSRRIAWIVAAMATTIALLEALALVALLPLKTIVPYTLLVDRTTGHVQLLKGTHPETITPGSALTQSLLSQYVIARESFDRATISDQYRRVALWSDEAARRDYLALMPASNAASPFNQLPGRAMLTTRIESVSMLGPQTALVRFTTRREDARSSGGTSPPSYWVAVIRYRYVGAPQALEDRLVNPLGFKVVSYRRDQEAPPASSLPGAAPVVTARDLSPVAESPRPQ